MPKYKTKIMIIVFLHHKEAPDAPLQFLATADISDPDSSKLFLPMAVIRKPHLSFSEATTALLKRAGVPFSEFVYEGIVAARNYITEDVHYFDFVLACEYTGKGFIARSSVAMTGQIHCMFFPFSKVLESVKHANDPLHNVLTHWVETSPTKTLPVLKPHEDYSWTGRALDLKAFVFILNSDNDSILLVENDRGHLYLPGGRFGQDEDLLTTAKRLTLQQAGVQVRVNVISEIVYGWADYSPLHFFVIGEVEGGVLKTAQDEHSKGVKWVAIDELVTQLNNQRGGAGGGGGATQFQKMWDIKATLLNFVENRKTNTCIPLYG